MSVELAGNEARWKRAFWHLERGEDESALALLAPVNSSELAVERSREQATSIDARIALLLGSTLRSAGGGDRTQTPPGISGDDRDGASSGQPVEDVVSCVMRCLEVGLVAVDALRTGRVGDLVRCSRSAAAAAPNEFPWLRLRVAALLQAAYRFTADPQLAEEALGACAPVADHVRLPHIAIGARGLMGSVHLLEGNFHAALDRCDAAIQLACAKGLQDHRCVALAHQFRGYVLFEWNRLAEVEPELERAWNLAGERGYGVRSGVARVMAQLHGVKGNRKGVDLWMERLTDLIREPMTLRNREWLAAVRLRVQDSVDLRTIEAWRRTYDYHLDARWQMADEWLPARLQEYDHLLALLEATRQWKVILEAAPVVRNAARDRRRWFETRALSVEAVALEHLGRHRAAESVWDEALAVGQPGSFVRVYVDGDPTRTRLLERSLNRPGSEDQAKRVLAAAPEFRQSTGSLNLTPTQISVLRLVSEGHSNQEVAEELGVALTTVKTHLRNIYQRMNVRSRTQAVAEARRSSLL